MITNVFPRFFMNHCILNFFYSVWTSQELQWAQQAIFRFPVSENQLVISRQVAPICAVELTKLELNDISQHKTASQFAKIVQIGIDVSKMMESNAVDPSCSLKARRGATVLVSTFI